MSVTLAFQALLADMQDGQIFTTRDVIGLGSRDAVDKCLQRLVDNSVILRLARGVFSVGNKKPFITPLELAQIKARAFHKEVYEHPETTAQRLGYTPKPQHNPITREPLTFATSGTGSTSFKSIFGTIHLKATSARKRNEFQDEVWEMAKSLWHLGKDKVTEKIRERITRVWGRKSQESLGRLCAFFPQWLFEQLPYNSENAFQRIYSNLVPHASERQADQYHGGVQWKQLLHSVPPAAYDFEPPDYERSAEDFAHTDDADNSPESKCWCPDSDECICPLFNCTYCQSQPIRNRFGMALG